MRVLAANSEKRSRRAIGSTFFALIWLSASAMLKTKLRREDSVKRNVRVFAYEGACLIPNVVRFYIYEKTTNRRLF